MGLGDREEREEDISSTLALQVIRRRLDFRLHPFKRRGGTSSKPRHPHINTARSRGRNPRPRHSRQRSRVRSSRWLASHRPTTIPGCRTCAPSVGRIAKRVINSGRLPDTPNLHGSGGLDTDSPEAGLIFGITSNPSDAPFLVATKDTARGRTSNDTSMKLSAMGPRGRLTARSAARGTRESITCSGI